MKDNAMNDLVLILILVIVVVVFIAVLVFGILRVRKHRKAVRAGWLAAQDGRLGDAQSIFKDLAYRHLGFFLGLGKEPFDEALRGLTDVYEKASVTADLEAIRQIRRAIWSLEKGKTKSLAEKLTSGGKIGEAVRGLYDGWKIENLIEEGRVLITALPDIDPAGHPRDRALRAGR